MKTINYFSQVDPATRASTSSYHPICVSSYQSSKPTALLVTLNMRKESIEKSHIIAEVGWCKMSSMAVNPGHQNKKSY